MYPWPSFGGFLFQASERPIWGTDAGWVKTPSYQRSRALGTSIDVINTLAIGSSERSFEINLTPTRFLQLEGMLNTRGSFTDWTRPLPETTYAFLSEVTPLEDVIARGDTTADKLGVMQRKRRTRITLVSS